MRKILFVLFVLFNSTGAKSQSWCPIGATWYFNHWNIWTGPGYIKRTYIGSNAIIDGKPCNQFLIETYGQIGNVSITGYFTYLNNDVVYNVPTVGSIKDTLFDFKAKPGDKWRMAPTIKAQCAAGKVTVLDTGSKIIQGQKLRWLKVNYLSSKVNFIDTIYERFGPLGVYSYNWFNVCPAGSDGEYGGSLRCYSDNQIPNFVNDHSTACDYYNGVGITKNQSVSIEIRIFPNPSTDLITIQFPNSNGDYNFKLINALGQIHLESFGHLEQPALSLSQGSRKVTDENQAQLNLSNLKTGIYFLQIWENGKLVGTEKIIKQ